MRKVFCCADPGYAMNPDGFTAQMEGGIIYGLTAALHGEISIRNGASVCQLLALISGPVGGKTSRMLWWGLVISHPRVGVGA